MDRANAGGMMKARQAHPWYMRPTFFVGLMVVSAAVATGMFGYFSWRVTAGSVAQVLLWLCLLPLLFNNAWMLWHSVYYCFLRDGVVFAEQPLARIPKTAIIFFVRKESTGLFERLEYSYRNNFLPNVHLWIVSGEAPERYITYEQDVLNRLRAIFGARRVHWMHSEDPANKKREMMELWLDKYDGEYKYFFACDADTMVPKNTLLRLLRKAEHPDNKDIGCFQANTQVGSACTYFADNNRNAVAILMELYLKVRQVVFGEVLSFGHNYLGVCSVMKHLNIPSGVLSHDIWDTVYLRRRGYRTVYCQDIIAYEESPSNYVEERRRNIRWMKGDLETLFLLFERAIPLRTRFLVYLNLHAYISCIGLFVLFNVITFTDLGGHSPAGRALITQLLLGFGVIAIILAHRLVIARCWNDVKEIFKEIVVSTLVTGNNILYVMVDLVFVMTNRQGWNLWDPMLKDPRKGVSLRQAAGVLWPGTVVGLCWIGWLLAHGEFSKLAWSSPIVLAFVLSIPTTYFTSKEMPYRRAGSALSVDRLHQQ
jgi:membrane glycosyltransferase